jgi:three-Cys-motif partner protein
MDMNMNALRREGAIEDAAQAARMTRYWGDESWKDAGYSKEATLFGPTDVKNENEVVVGAFADRLRAVAGFKFVAKPLPMKNGIGRTVYYLLFASQNKTAHKIISDIFRNKSEQASS